MTIKQLLNTDAQKRIIYLFASMFMLAGIVFRVVVFFQNRNLIIDEANIVRNIYERNFSGLLQPLSYEQYAPPLFLWIEELFSHIFGYSEKAMRLFALLCGSGSLYVFWCLLKKILPPFSALLPLGLFCFAPTLVKYATEVKQYVPDALVAISLVSAALRIHLNSMPSRKFFIIWAIVGSIAIWASQPSVFILASLGFYYFVQCVQLKKMDKFPLLLLIAAIWLLQFLVYYWFILRAQINSDYLQNYHHDYFLYALPHSAAELRHNWLRIREILCNTAGYNMVSLYCCAFFIFLGSIALFRKSFALFVLLVGPILITLLAAALHQFSLIERVCIFILPFTMILVGFGFDVLLKIKFRLVHFGAVAIGMYMLCLYNYAWLLLPKYQFNELTVCMDYVMDKGGKGNELYVDFASNDTYIYYTRIHPEKNRYASLSGAHLLHWNDQADRVATQVNTQNAYFIFTGGDPALREKNINEMKTILQQTDYFEYYYSYVFTFQKK